MTISVDYEVVEYGKLNDTSRGIPDFSELEFTPGLRHSGLSYHESVKFLPRSTYARNEGAFTAGVLFVDQDHLALVETQRRNESEITQLPGRAFNQVRFSLFTIEEMSRLLGSGFVPYPPLFDVHRSATSYSLPLHTKPTVHRSSLKLEVDDQVMGDHFAAVLKNRWLQPVSFLLAAAIRGMRIEMIVQDDCSLEQRLEFASLFQILLHQIPSCRTKGAQRFATFQLDQFSGVDCTLAFSASRASNQISQNNVVTMRLSSAPVEVVLQDDEQEGLDADSEKVMWLLEELFASGNWSKGIRKFGQMAGNRWRTSNSLLCHPIPSHSVLVWFLHKGSYAVEKLLSRSRGLLSSMEDDDREELIQCIVQAPDQWIAPGESITPIYKTLIDYVESSKLRKTMFEQILVYEGHPSSLEDAIKFYRWSAQFEDSEMVADSFAKEYLTSVRAIHDPRLLIDELKHLTVLELVSIISRLLENKQEDVLKQLFQIDVAYESLRHPIVQLIRKWEQSDSQARLIKLWIGSAPNALPNIDFLLMETLSALNRQSIDLIERRFDEGHYEDFPIEVIMRFRRTLREYKRLTPLAEYGLLDKLARKAQRSQNIDYLGEICFQEIPLFFEHSPRMRSERTKLQSLFLDCLTAGARIFQSDKSNYFAILAKPEPVPSLFQFLTTAIRVKTSQATLIFVFGCVAQYYLQHNAALSYEDVDLLLHEFIDTEDWHELEGYLWNSIRSDRSTLLKLADNHLARFLVSDDRINRLRLVAPVLGLGRTLSLFAQSKQALRSEDVGVLLAAYPEFFADWLNDFPIEDGEAWLLVWRMWHDARLITSFLEKYPHQNRACWLLNRLREHPILLEYLYRLSDYLGIAGKLISRVAYESCTGAADARSAAEAYGLLLNQVANQPTFTERLLETENWHRKIADSTPWIAKFLYTMRMTPKQMGISENLVEVWILRASNDEDSHRTVQDECDNIIRNYASFGRRDRVVNAQLAYEILLNIALRTKAEGNLGLRLEDEIRPMISSLRYYLSDQDVRELRRVIEHRSGLRKRQDYLWLADTLRILEAPRSVVFEPLPSEGVSEQTNRLVSIRISRRRMLLVVIVLIVLLLLTIRGCNPDRGYDLTASPNPALLNSTTSNIHNGSLLSGEQPQNQSGKQVTPEASQQNTQDEHNR